MGRMGSAGPTSSPSCFYPAVASSPPGSFFGGIRHLLKGMRTLDVVVHRVLDDHETKLYVAALFCGIISRLTLTAVPWMVALAATADDADGVQFWLMVATACGVLVAVGEGLSRMLTSELGARVLARVTTVLAYHVMRCLEAANHADLAQALPPGMALDNDSGDDSDGLDVDRARSHRRRKRGGKGMKSANSMIISFNDSAASTANDPLEQDEGQGQGQGGGSTGGGAGAGAGAGAGIGDTRGSFVNRGRADHDAQPAPPKKTAKLLAFEKRAATLAALLTFQLLPIMHGLITVVLCLGITIYLQLGMVPVLLLPLVLPTAVICCTRGTTRDTLSASSRRSLVDHQLLVECVQAEPEEHGIGRAMHGLKLIDARKRRDLLIIAGRQRACHEAIKWIALLISCMLLVWTATIRYLTGLMTVFELLAAIMYILGGVTSLRSVVEAASIWSQYAHRVGCIAVALDRAKQSNARFRSDAGAGDNAASTMLRAIPSWAQPDSRLWSQIGRLIPPAAMPVMVAPESARVVLNGITCSDAIVEVGGQPIQVSLNSLHLDLAPGSTTVVIGDEPTLKLLLQVLLYLRTPSKGDVSIGGTLYSSVGAEWVRSTVGYLCHKTTTFSTSAEKNLGLPLLLPPHLRVEPAEPCCGCSGKPQPGRRSTADAVRDQEAVEGAVQTADGAAAPAGDPEQGNAGPQPVARLSSSRRLTARYAAADDSYERGYTTSHVNDPLFGVSGTAIRQRILASAADCGLDVTIAALPNNYDTLLGPFGANIEEAQATKLGMARLELVNPPVVVVEQPQSATAWTMDCEEALASLAMHRTSIVLSPHPGSMLERHPEWRAAVIVAGEVAEQGSHEELMRKNGHYASMFGV